LSEKFVVMYSGNHSPCHPLDTLLDAARALKERSEIVFCFVGGGSEQIKVRDRATKHGLTNVKCLPYQPLNELAGSLSAADLHVVVMGEPFVGIVHPCKVYNIMSVGAPTLYIGPTLSHVTDIASKQQYRFFIATHGDVNGVVKAVLQATKEHERQPVITFAKHILLPQLIDVIEARQDFQDFSRLIKIKAITRS
jgi:glycosyltransferase involved in cell wall biosynthesis